MEALRSCRFKWLGKQLAKYLSIQYAGRCLDGRACAGPLMGGLVVLNRCNSRCPMCDIPMRPEQVLTTAQMKALIDQFMELGTSGLGFTGGEPLLRHDIFELIQYARGYGIPVTLNTNGILLDPGNVECLLEAEPTNVNISLDGAFAQTHDRLRGGPFFEKTIDAISRLSSAASRRNSKTVVTVVTVISEENVGELQETARLVKTLGAHRWGVMPLHNTHHGTECRPLASEKLRGLSRWLMEIQEVVVDNSASYLRALESAWAGEPFPHRCNAGYTSLFVDSNLQVYPCLGYYMMGRSVYKLGSETMTLRQLWYSELYRSVRNETLTCRQCYLNCQSELSYLVPI